MRTINGIRAPIVLTIGIRALVILTIDIRAKC